MGNSAPHIKEIGDIIVATNDENGVAEAIEGYALNGQKTKITEILHLYYKCNIYCFEEKSVV